MALISENIPPLSSASRHGLVDRYCPLNLQRAARANPANKDCLARVYLGRRCPTGAPLPPNFTLRNFNLCLDLMLDLNLPVISYAAAMGDALAIIHWAANVDAYDVEFVLGSEPDKYSQEVSSALNMSATGLAALNPHTSLESMLTAKSDRRTRRMWVLDFNLCSVWEDKVGWEAPEGLIAPLVTAFFENDPYFPLPLAEHGVDRRLWKTFSSEYLRKAKFSRRQGRMRDCVICLARLLVPASRENVGILPETLVMDTGSVRAKLSVKHAILDATVQQWPMYVSSSVFCLCDFSLF